MTARIATCAEGTARRTKPKAESIERRRGPLGNDELAALREFLAQHPQPVWLPNLLYVAECPRSIFAHLAGTSTPTTGALVVAAHRIRERAWIRAQAGLLWTLNQRCLRELPAAIGVDDFETVTKYRAELLCSHTGETLQ